jgi:hypothetical protein
MPPLPHLPPAALATIAISVLAAPSTTIVSRLYLSSLWVLGHLLLHLSSIPRRDRCTMPGWCTKAQIAGANMQGTPPALMETVGVEPDLSVEIER